ncbi:MAG: YfiR family protein [Reichenbachiella sp.]
MKPFIILICSVLIAYSANAQNESKYKSLLIYKISEYIVWPSVEGQIQLGAVGNSDINDMLMSFSNKREHMNVVNIDDSGQLGNCQMVYLPESQEEQLKLFRAKVGFNSVLIVSEVKEHITKGADIVVFTENRKLKFIVNEKTINQKGMIASKKLATLGDSI